MLLLSLSEKENKNDEENGNAPDDKKENGITNPAYEAATKQSNDVKPENDVTITTKEVIINEEENERAIQEKTKVCREKNLILTLKVKRISCFYLVLSIEFFIF